MTRYLIVNADDFGLSSDVNRGITETIERGIVTSASLMVRQPAAAQAAEYASKNRSFSLGLHLDLGEWVYSNGDWVQVERVVCDEDEGAVRREIQRQLKEFRRLVGRDPSHLDSHQHVHRKEPVLSAMRQVACELAIPLRQFSPEIRYCGDFYGQDGDGSRLRDVITEAGLGRILKRLPEGTSELGCHPGYVGGLRSVYRREREKELRVLCRKSIRTSLKALQIELRTFEDFRNSAPELSSFASRVRSH